MAGDLEDAVGGGVENWEPGANVLGAKAGDNVGAGGMAISERTRATRTAEDFVEEILGKTIRDLRKIAPVETHGHTGDFPMTAGRILTSANGLG